MLASNDLGDASGTGPNIDVPGQSWSVSTESRVFEAQENIPFIIRYGQPTTQIELVNPPVECEVYAAMMEAMVANGGEEPTLFLWNCDRYPYPHPFRVPTTRPMQRGDLIICEMHPKFGGYFTHVERTFCLGEPEQQQLAIYDGCIAAYRRGLENFGPGKTISTALEAVKDETDTRGLGICEAGIHGHGRHCVGK